MPKSREKLVPSELSGSESPSHPSKPMEPNPSESKVMKPKSALVSKSSIFKIIYVLQHLKLKAKSTLERRSRQIKAEVRNKSKLEVPNLQKMESLLDPQNGAQKNFNFNISRSNEFILNDSRLFKKESLKRSPTPKKETHKALNGESRLAVLWSRKLQWREQARVKAFYKLVNNCQLMINSERNINRLIKKKLNTNLPLVLQNDVRRNKFYVTNRNYILFRKSETVKSIYQSPNNIFLGPSQKKAQISGDQMGMLHKEPGGQSFPEDQLLDPNCFVSFGFYNDCKLQRAKMFSLINENCVRVATRESQEIDYRPFYLRFESDPVRRSSRMSSQPNSILEYHKKKFYCSRLINRRKEKQNRKSNLKRGFQSLAQKLVYSTSNLDAHQEKSKHLEPKLVVHVVLGDLHMQVGLPIYVNLMRLVYDKKKSLLDKNLHILKHFYEKLRCKLQRDINQCKSKRVFKESTVSKMESIYSMPGSIFNLSRSDQIRCSCSTRARDCTH